MSTGALFALSHETIQGSKTVTCGPASLAAITGLSHNDVLSHMPEYTGGTSREMMCAALNRIGVTWSACQKKPTYGLALIGWLEWRDDHYGQTGGRHWIGIDRQSVFDVNAGWLGLSEWERRILPALTVGAKEPGWDRKWTASTWRKKNRIAAPGEWTVIYGIDVQLPAGIGER